MDVAAFCRQSTVVVVAGKGGTGKTTLSTTLALTGAKAGLDVLLVALEDSISIPILLEHPGMLTYEDTLLATNQPGNVRGRLLTSNAALLDYLNVHGLGSVAKRLVKSGAADIVATAIPGIKEVLVLGKLKQLESSKSADLIVVDAPASGHALTYLRNPRAMQTAARTGPLHDQSEQITEMLTDPTRAQVLLVTLAEETPVNETIETAFRLEDEVGVALGPIVVNAVTAADLLHPSVSADSNHIGSRSLSDSQVAILNNVEAFIERTIHHQQAQIDRLARDLPIPQITLPRIWHSRLTRADLEILSSYLVSAIDTL